MEMTFFNLLTPITYWVLIVMWFFILCFYLKRVRMDWHQNRLMLLLFIILTIDAFRTLFESFYFGAWYTARVGLLPIGIHDFLVQPQMVIIPKLLNVFAAGLIITILFRFWLPREGEAIKQLQETVNMRTRELLEAVEKLEKEKMHYKQVEEALAAKNMELNNLADSSPGLMGTFYLRPDGSACMPYTSPQIENLFGLRAEDVVDDAAPLLARTHPEDANGVNESIAESASTMTPWHHEYRVIHPARGEIWLEGSTNPKPHPEGGVIWYGFVHDITQRKRAEEALKESEAKYMDLYENAPDMYASANAETGLIEECNMTLANILGYSKEEIIGRSVFDIYHPDCLEEVKETFKLFFETGKVHDKELQLQKKNESAIDVSLNVTSVRGEDGHILFSRSTLHDITQRKRAEETLRKLSYAVEQSPASIVITDTAGNIEYVNRKFTEVTGYAKIEVLGKNPRILKSGKLPNAFYKQLWDSITSGKQWHGEFHNRKKNGDLYWESASISPIFDTAGTITHFVGVKEDITERKRLEAQFRQAQKMESVGRLAGGVAHDFNNMLGVIIGHTELALDQLDPGQPLYADLLEIRKSARRSADLTRQLLGFARKQTVAPRVIDLNAIMTGILTMLRRLIGEDIDLAWIPGAELWPVKVDPSQVDQVLANLCVNARDAIAGVGKITIETGNTSLDETYCADHPGFIPGEYAMLTVSDNGHGMDKETQDKIFEPFFTTKEIGKGTGLGLATVYGIVKQNSGFINVYSEPGHGTTFKIYLPRHAAMIEPAHKEGPEAPVVQGHETILLVEDDPATLEMGSRMLERFGYHVLSASTPGEAIRLAKERDCKVNLVITDVIMPEMNGRDLVKHLTSLCPGIKHLFMSGYSGNVIARHGVLDEDENFIQKPFSMQDLAAKIREVLENE